jgi:hypothetical protein
MKTFGYNIPENVDNFYDDEDEDDIYLFGDMEDNLDEQEVISFLNEYYLIYPGNLPDAELY